ncbi:MAG TPA: VWA domain-containing protein [Anaerolineae bacterium]|nr:VWA domain-containing protein [Anaerolineae bacterium]HQK12852.1 VWA domain-containing protein [Anaerolineae bacterium]
MRFLNPAGFLGLLLAVPIVLLYMLRLHRQNVPVPSLLLWEAVLADRHANRPWQKLRRNWLLFLQLLILLTLVCGIARPALPAPLTFHGQVIVLLDASASMQAHDADGVTRFEVAQRELRRLAAALDQGDRVALIAVGPAPVLLLQGGDATAFRRALEAAAPVDGAADWRAAAALAAGLASGDTINTVLVTDAAIAEALPSLPGNVHMITVPRGAANVGIVAFALRRAAEGLTAFVRLFNDGPATSRTLALYVDGVLVERRPVELPAEGATALTFGGLPALTWAEARLEETDALAVDDQAWIAVAARGGGRVLLVTPGNRFLAQALRALPDLTLSQSATLEPGMAGDYGIIVADGPVTTTLPAANMWLIMPGAGSPCGEPGAVVTPTLGVRGQWSHPLLHYVEWADVHVARARAYTVPDDAEVLLETAAGPLLWTIERPGQRLVCMAFDLHDSDLPLRLAFPILTANVTGWLMPQLSTEPLLPLPSGTAWEPELPPATTAATLITPDGRRLALSPDAPRTLETAAGLYRIEAQTSAGTLTRYAALSLLAEGESDLRPREIRVGGKLLPPAEAVPGWRDLSRWAIAVALVLLLLEAVLWWGPSLFRYLTPPRPRPISLPLSRSPALPLTPSPSIFHRLPSTIIRLVLITLLILALADVYWSRSTRDLAIVFLLDRSASTRSAWEAQLDFVQTALAHKSPQDRAALVVFAGDAWVDRALSAMATLPEIATLPRIDATDIESAVRLGLALIPEGAPGRLVLLTDGLETSGRAAWALREAQARGVDVQLVQVGSGTPEAETWIADMRLPTRVYPGDRVPVMVEIGSTAQQNLRLTWTAGGQTGQEGVRVLGTSETLAFSFTAGDAGFIPLRVCLDPEYDTFAQNNCADGWVLVQGAPRILVVGAPEDYTSLLRALEETGLTVEVAAPESMPLTAPALVDYAAIIIVNTPARSFAPQSLSALRTFVRDLGGGLIAIGGPQSYGVGGWLGTPLEEALPVQMQVQDPRRFPPLVMAVVIDKSGSMGVEETGVMKIRLAAEAAIRVAETLNDTDTLAVVAYDDRPADTFGPATMDQRDILIGQLRRLQPGGGGIYVRESLLYAADLLRNVKASPDTQRHILLLADGSDAEHQEQVPALVEKLVDEGMTVSVVSIGQGSDVPFLRQVAESGQGRFYLTERAADLPAIFAEETARVKRSYIVEKTFYPEPLTPWLPLADIAATPPLRGYVATTPKSAAQVVWNATEPDPLLAVWQYGLGRAVAWTSDATGRWGSEWVTWEGFSEFWGAVVRAVLPSPADSGLALRVLAEGDRAHVVVDVVAPEAATGAGYVDALDLRLSVTPVGVGQGESQTVKLVQRAPGRYEGYFTPAGRSTLLLRLHGDRDLVAGWAVPTPLEYIPGDALAAVAQLTAQGGGTDVSDPAEVFVHNLRGRTREQPLAPLLILIAALLWPVDIAWRRLALTRADVARWFGVLREWLRRLRRVPRPAPETPPTLAETLRQRQRRAERAARPAPVAPPESGSVLPSVPPEQPGTVTPPAPVKPAIPSPEPETLAARLKRRIRE